MLLSLLLLLQVVVPVFESETGPGEGPYEYRAVATELAIHEQPSSTSRLVKTLPVKKDQLLTPDAERYRTMRAGSIRVLAKAEVTGRLIGKVSYLSINDYYSRKYPETKVPVRTRDVIDYLQYRAEGSCFVQIQGKVLDSACPVYDKTHFKLEREPKTELWVHLPTPKDAAGWVLVTDAAIKRVYN